MKVVKPKRGRPKADETHISRFIDRITIDENGCWNWNGYLSLKGYGTFCTDYQRQRSHRYSYNYFVGEIPDRLQIDHLCRNKSCVNPAHLDIVTSKENTHRGMAFNSGVGKRGKDKQKRIRRWAKKPDRS